MLWSPGTKGPIYWNGIGRIYLTWGKTYNTVYGDDGFIVMNGGGNWLSFINTNWPPRVFNGIAELTPLFRSGDNDITIILKDYWGGAISTLDTWIYFDQTGTRSTAAIQSLVPKEGFYSPYDLPNESVYKNCTNNTESRGGMSQDILNSSDSCPYSDK